MNKHLIAVMLLMVVGAMAQRRLGAPKYRAGPTLEPWKLPTLLPPPPPPPPFATSGCGWDFFLGSCRDIANTCAGKCVNFGSKWFSDCRCAVPELRPLSRIDGSPAKP